MVDDFGKIIITSFQQLQSGIIIIIIIIYFENVAKLESGICPKVKNQTSGDLHKN